MPTYEYECDACGHLFEEFQSIKAKPIKVCPSCGKSKVNRLIGTGGGVIFKGSGFYQTDYRSEASKKAEKADKESQKATSNEKDTSSGSSDKAGTSSESSESKTKSDTAKDK